MANLATVLKEEVGRLARKEIRQQTAEMAKAVVQTQREIAALKRQIQTLTGQLSSHKPEESRPMGRKKAARKKAGRKKTGRKKTAAKPAGKATAARSSTRARFSTKGLKASREQLGLSADNFGKLIGVSGLSIYNWEQGKARPRESSIEALAKIKGMGKREAIKRLEELKS